MKHVLDGAFAPSRFQILSASKPSFEFSRKVCCAKTGHVDQRRRCWELPLEVLHGSGVTWLVASGASDMG
jgi:hypothetical protein